MRPTFRKPALLPLAMIILLVVTAGACSSKKKPAEERRHGTVKEVDPIKRTLLMSEKEPDPADTNQVVKVKRTYRVALNCRVETVKKLKAELADVQVGDRINYRFTVIEDVPVIHKITPRGAGTNFIHESKTSLP